MREADTFMRYKLSLIITAVVSLLVGVLVEKLVPFPLSQTPPAERVA